MFINSGSFAAAYITDTLDLIEPSVGLNVVGFHAVVVKFMVWANQYGQQINTTTVIHMLCTHIFAHVRCTHVCAHVRCTHIFAHVMYTYIICTYHVYMFVLLLLLVLLPVSHVSVLPASRHLSSLSSGTSPPPPPSFRLVNVSSLLAHIPLAGCSLYCATKAYREAVIGVAAVEANQTFHDFKFLNWAHQMSHQT
eukprot:GHVS01107816.1.p1 GENE.GHVS01107816.1~~GHVS01107816.1.p1  ORF type:complete len:195 (+),score=28.41 GHVS01107816.1:277-861(+)